MCRVVRALLVAQRESSESGESTRIRSDATQYAKRHKPMRGAYLYLSVDSPEEAERIHALLAEGGEIFMPLEETFFARRFSMLRDRFGTSWSVICERAMPERS